MKFIAEGEKSKNCWMEVAMTAVVSAALVLPLWIAAGDYVRTALVSGDYLSLFWLVAFSVSFILFAVSLFGPYEFGADKKENPKWLRKSPHHDIRDLFDVGWSEKRDENRFYQLAESYKAEELVARAEEREAAIHIKAARRIGNRSLARDLRLSQKKAREQAEKAAEMVNLAIEAAMIAREESERLKAEGEQEERKRVEMERMMKKAKEEISRMRERS